MKQLRAFEVALPSEARLPPQRISPSPLLAVALAGWLFSAGTPAATAEERPNAAGRNALGSTTWTDPVGPPPAATPRVSPARPAPEAAARATPPASRGGPPNEGRAAPVVRPADVLPRPEPEAPLPDELLSVTTRETFRGTTYNETLGRSGGLRLVVTNIGPGDAVVVRFDASGGLIGAGQLTGRLSRDGRLVASGTLMMGQNPFATELAGVISRDGLVGDVRYTRAVEPDIRPSSTRGTFELTRD